MAFNPPSFSDVPGADAVVGAVTDVASETADATTDVVDAVVDATTEVAGSVGVDTSGGVTATAGADGSFDIGVSGRPGVTVDAGAVADGVVGVAAAVGAAEIGVATSVGDAVVDVAGAVTDDVGDAARSTGDDRIGLEVSGHVAVTVDADGTARVDADPRVGVDLGSASDGASGVAAAVGAAAAGGAAEIADEATNIEHTIEDTHVGVDAGGDVTLNRTGDGQGTFDVEGHLGVQVNDDEVGVGTQFHAEVAADGSKSARGDTGAYSDVDGHHDEAGITIAQTNSADQVRDTTIGGYAERDDDRVEGGVFQTTDTDFDPLRGDITRRDESGVYGAHNDDEVRAGTTVDHGGTGQLGTDGVFVQDAEGDRTGVGVIEQSKFSSDTAEVGTGGIYVDVDGEHHDAHADVGFVSNDDGTYVQGAVDPGPVELSGSAGIDTRGEGARGFATGGVTTESNQVGANLGETVSETVAAAATAAAGVGIALDDGTDDGPNDAPGDGPEDGIDDGPGDSLDDGLDDLPHIDGLDEPDMELPDLPDDLPMSALDTGQDDLPVVVHDGFGDPMAAADAAFNDAQAAADTVEDPVDDSSNSDDGNVLDSVTGAVGDALGAVGDAVGDALDGLFD